MTHLTDQDMARLAARSRDADARRVAEPEAPVVRRRPGRPPGRRNRRTVLGQDYLASLNPKAKRRLRQLVESGEDDVALKAAQLILAYCFGRPVEATVSANMNANINGEAEVGRVELARRLAFLIASGADAAREGADEGDDDSEEQTDE